MTLQNLHIKAEDLEQIEALFSEKFQVTESSYLINIRNERINANICAEIFPEKGGRYLVSVYTNNTHLQLQACTNLIISGMLEEIIFISETDTHISGLIVSKQGDCALYSNVDKKILRSDFTELNSEKLLAAVALSIIETVN
ncbi:MAG TPA: hypothetical protein PKC91_08625 [Ignavibacteria bacterium]|nr:hypothetical protein [Ignavibacteria bacterium]